MGVRWKDRVEDVFDGAVGEYERQPFVKDLAIDLEGRQSEFVSKGAIAVAQEFERQIKPVAHLTLIAG